MKTETEELVRTKGLARQAGLHLETAHSSAAGHFVKLLNEDREIFTLMQAPQNWAAYHIEHYLATRLRFVCTRCYQGFVGPDELYQHWLCEE